MAHSINSLASFVLKRLSYYLFDYENKEKSLAWLIDVSYNFQFKRFSNVCENNFNGLPNDFTVLWKSS